jgi:hypothetical protein
MTKRKMTMMKRSMKSESTSITRRRSQPQQPLSILLRHRLNKLKLKLQFQAIPHLQLQSLIISSLGTKIKIRIRKKKMKKSRRKQSKIPPRSRDGLELMKVNKLMTQPNKKITGVMVEEVNIARGSHKNKDILVQNALQFRRLIQIQTIENGTRKITNST